MTLDEKSYIKHFVFFRFLLVSVKLLRRFLQKSPSPACGAAKRVPEDRPGPDRNGRGQKGSLKNPALKQRAAALLLLLVSFSPPFSPEAKAEEFLSPGLPCIVKMRERFDALFKGTISHRERDHLFECLQDGLFVFKDKYADAYLEPDGWFTTEQLAMIYWNGLEGSEPHKAWEFAVKILIIKKLLVGGAVDKIEAVKACELAGLSFPFERFFLHIQKRIRFYYAVLTGRPYSVPPDYPKYIERLQWSFGQLLQGYKNLRLDTADQVNPKPGAIACEGVSYSTKDLGDLYEYIRVLNFSAEDFRKILLHAQRKAGGGAVPLDFHKTVQLADELNLNPFRPEEERRWRTLADFVRHYAEGGFEGPIYGERFSVLAESFKPLIALYFTYRVHVAGKDMSDPLILSQAVQALEYAADSLLLSESVRKGRGFPATHFAGLTGAILSQAGGSSPLSRLGHKGKEDALSLAVRLMTCFSLPPADSSSCRIRRGEEAAPALTVFSFPDADYTFHPSGRQSRRAKHGRPPALSARQIRSLKGRLRDFRRKAVNLTPRLRETATESGFGRWMTSEFYGLNSEGRLQFGRAGAAKRLSLAKRQMHQSFLLGLFLPENMLPSLDERNIPFLSLEEWQRLSDRIVPLISVLFDFPYTEKTRNLTGFLFEYGDLLLNSSSKNNRLEFSEMMDVTTHLSAADQNARFAFREISAACGAPARKLCAADTLFNDGNILSVLPLWQTYFASFGSKEWARAAEAVLPETVRSPRDLLAFFIIAQLTEVLFYKYDFNEDYQLDESEFQIFVRGFRKKIKEVIPHLHTERQAEVYLRYAIDQGNLPFLMEKGRTFSSLNFSRWLKNPKIYKSRPVYRLHLFSFLIDFYNLGRQFNKI